MRRLLARARARADVHYVSCLCARGPLLALRARKMNRGTREKFKFSRPIHSHACARVCSRSRARLIARRVNSKREKQKELFLRLTREKVWQLLLCHKLLENSRCCEVCVLRLFLEWPDVREYGSTGVGKCVYKSGGISFEWNRVL